MPPPARHVALRLLTILVLADRCWRRRAPVTRLAACRGGGYSAALPCLMILRIRHVRQQDRLQVLLQSVLGRPLRPQHETLPSLFGLAIGAVRSYQHVAACQVQTVDRGAPACRHACAPSGCSAPLSYKGCSQTTLASPSGLDNLRRFTIPK